MRLASDMMDIFEVERKIGVHVTVIRVLQSLNELHISVWFPLLLSAEKAV